MTKQIYRIVASYTASQHSPAADARKIDTNSLVKPLFFSTAGYVWLLIEPPSRQQPPRLPRLLGKTNRSEAVAKRQKLKYAYHNKNNVSQAHATT